MRELVFSECAGISGGAESNDRDPLREFVVDISFVPGAFLGTNIGVAGATNMKKGLPYAVGSAIIGAFAGIVAGPVLAKIGLEVAFVVHDCLV